MLITDRLRDAVEKTSSDWTEGRLRHALFNAAASHKINYDNFIITCHMNKRYHPFHSLTLLFSRRLVENFKNAR